MKVVLMGCTPPPVGGIAMWTKKIMESKLKNGWQIHLVDTKMIRRESFGDKTKRNYFVEFIRWKRIYKNLNKALNDPQALVVHSCCIATTFSLMANIISASIVQKRKKKFVAHFRCTVPNMIHSDFQKYLLKIFCKKCDMIFSLNNQTSSYLKKYFNGPIEIIPNFIEKDEIVDHKEIRDNITQICYTGGVTEEKGCLNIIDIAKNKPDIKFVLAGNPSEACIKASKECSNVILKGVVEKDQINQILNESDVFIFLSHYSGEGFSNSLAEAMAHGLPAIVSDWASNSEMIDDCKGGVVLDNTNVNSCLDALNKISNSETRKKMSEYNIEKVKCNYLSSIILDKYVDAYEKLI